MPQKKQEDVVDGYTIKYHANGKTVWSKGKMLDGDLDGYWEWFLIDGTSKQSGRFATDAQVGDWTTYHKDGKVYKVTSFD